jgi:2-keto-4-pentenoate hydratase/2-oxohepta-3-ene-1,7-dioic acid hydratase in catechol pathway
LRFGTVVGWGGILWGVGFAALDAFGLPSDPLAALDRWDEVRAVPVSTWQPLQRERLGPPVPNPRQVFALALNYRDHAAEAGLEVPEQPYAFTKFPSCIVGPHDDVVLVSNRCDWEVELVVVLGRECYQVPVEEAWDVVAGLTVGQDISERRVQFRKPFQHLAAAKSFPTFGPTGPWITTTDELADRDALAIRCSVNGELVQDSSTSQLVFDVAALIADLSSRTRLLPGDLVFTGTPAGVGSTRDPRRYLQRGDVIESEIEGLGRMVNTCR